MQRRVPVLAQGTHTARLNTTRARAHDEAKRRLRARRLTRARTLSFSLALSGWNSCTALIIAAVTLGLLQR